MQLTDQTVAAAGLRCRLCAGGTGRFERDSRIWWWTNFAMVVSRLDCSAVDDEDEQQQTEAALHTGSLVLKCVHQHAGPCPLC